MNLKIKIITAFYGIIFFTVYVLSGEWQYGWIREYGLATGADMHSYGTMMFLAIWTFIYYRVIKRCG